MDIYVHHGTKSEPNSYIRTSCMHLYMKFDAKSHSLLIGAKTVLQRALLSKMWYELRQGQNRDIDWG